MTGARFGQHFLINHSLAQKEIDYAQLGPTDVVLEIGPGHGILTKLLAQRVKQVIAVEIDHTLVEELRECVPENVALIHADILKLDLTTLPRYTKIVANLPFQISSEITFKLLETSFNAAVLMYQYDFAARMIAPPGSKQYSRLSVGIYYKTFCSIKQRVSRGNFFPPPQVDAAIVEVLPRSVAPFQIMDESLFFEVCKHLFSHRRKKIGTTIATQYKIREGVPFGNQRVEQLTPEEIGVISDFIFTAKKRA
ncbi:MAG: ribosomal RNA small subunit methyltransferase A [Candidatus Thermoplasmatota archaeon]|nr:ribosomal RNA small subunit methyltransferase A [Candidatus Thermoplasmatota archaeon]MBU1941788.1 ribosomal RNA small subunit methyltransferase A [Candidatus Thermoplasmatota archaeon]